MTESTPAFPGATGVTLLDVYDWTGPDGLPGGSAHVHLASTEGYVVASGEGRLQTLGGGGYAETPLRPGDCLWFTPGTIHRLVNDGGLRLFVVMQNAGLPEHGDAVLTFPPDILADPERYAAAAALPGPAPGGDTAGTDDTVGGGDNALAEAARWRAALAVEGYLELRAAVAEKGPEALEGFYAMALALKSELEPDWRDRWRAGALASAELTGTHLDEIGARVPGHLARGELWRIERPAGARSYGMCGRLTTYPAAAAVRAG